MNKKLNELNSFDFIKEIKSNGWKPYLVGGCVRDHFMGVEPKDIDIIIVGSEKEELVSLLSKYGKADLVGESFAVIKFSYKGEVYDIATPRIEIKNGDGYKGFEVITNKNISLETDLKRRDITINSMAISFDGELVDPFKGLVDLENSLIKITNKEAFSEDPLRIMRCARLSSRFNFEIDINTKSLIKDFKDDIKHLSQERICDEFVKAFNQSKDFNIFLKLLTDFDMWGQVFPGVSINTNFIKSNDFLIHITNLFKNEVPSRQLETKLIQDFKFEKEFTKKIIFLLNTFSMKVEDVPDMFDKKRQCFISDSAISEWLKINSVSDFRTKFIDFKPSVSSKELMDQGITGRELGLEIKRLEIENFKRML